MSAKRILVLWATALVIMVACKRQPTDINLEQKDNPVAAQIITPGMSSVGVIRDGQIFVYYLNEKHVWTLDQVSQFQIPSKNEGLLALGMGTIATLHKDKLYFYYMNASHQWDQDYELTMPLPQGYTRISAMKMPWQHGAIAIEDENRVVKFYYLDEDKRWQVDETANFVLPEGIDNYIMMGAMDIAIISDNKVGIYQLDYNGQWTFRDDMVLSLPEKTQALLPFEPGVIAVLADNRLMFFEADSEEGYWVIDDSMTFPIP